MLNVCMIWFDITWLLTTFDFDFIKKYTIDDILHPKLNKNLQFI